uniref:Uncharacterized protein n=1 Tax=Solanum tuberosum TaxID=4113 RepID=M1D639_SOLTU
MYYLSSSLASLHETIIILASKYFNESSSVLKLLYFMDLQLRCISLLNFKIGPSAVMYLI